MLTASTTSTTTTTKTAVALATKAISNTLNQKLIQTHGYHQLSHHGSGSYKAVAAPSTSTSNFGFLPTPPLSKHNDSNVGMFYYVNSPLKTHNTTRFLSTATTRTMAPAWKTTASVSAPSPAVNSGSSGSTTSLGGMGSSNSEFDSNSSFDFSTLGIDPKRLSSLDVSSVRRIKQELMEVDINNDGRIDAGELKKLMSRHGSTFTDEEIVEIGELFYAAKAGGSVPFEKFIEAVDRAAAAADDNAKGETKDPLKEAGEAVKETSSSIHFKTTPEPHPLGVSKCATEFLYGRTHHGVYTEEELDVKLTHLEPQTFMDRMAFNAVKVVRFFFDNATGWNRGQITQDKILFRAIYLETIAAIPGMVAAIIRHFRSLRRMERDGGLLNMFLEEANNERMHLLTFIKMRNPGTFFRALVIAGQFGFGSGFLLAYLASPAFCHRFVGYIEEEACTTYTKIIEAIEEAPEGSELASWRTEAAPRIAISYWHLGETGTVLDMFYAVRADEAEHRDVNHVVSGIPPGVVNPLYDPEEKLDQMLLKYVQDIMKTK